MNDNIAILKNIHADRLLETYNEQDLEALEKIGVLKDKSVDEIAELRKEIELNDKNTDNACIHINPTMDCNFSCWYCYENHIRGSKMSEKTLESVKLYISEFLNSSRKPKTFNLGFFGGEPFMCFEDTIKPIIEHTSNVCSKTDVHFNISFTTNGSLLTDSTLSYLSSFNCSMQITIDGDNKTHDRIRFYKGGRGSYNDIVTNIKKCLQMGIYVTVRINYTASILKNCYDIISKFKGIDTKSKKLFTIDLQRVWQDSSSSLLSREEVTDEIDNLKSAFEKEGIQCTIPTLTGYKNSCYGDKLSYRLINYDGEVYPCTARDFTHENSIGYLDSDGKIVMNQAKVALRFASKLSLLSCKKCRIAPLCGGGCRTKIIENSDTEKCLLGLSEEDKDNIVINRIEEIYLNGA